MVENGDEFSDIHAQEIQYDVNAKFSDRIILSSPSPDRIKKRPLVIENSNFIHSNTHYSTSKTEYKAA